MAFRSTGYWKQMVNRLRGNATYGTSTSPKMKAYAPAADDFGNVLREERSKSKMGQKGDYVPVYVALGLIALSTMLGLHTAKQQLLYSPSVRVKKKLRETIPEVVCPEKVVDEAHKFVAKSFLRKAAHIQEFDSALQSLPDIYANPPRAETLKSIGIDPKLD
ncbi:uncharacterized protein LOC8275470 [Ricinus communis]|uniref:Uncharacterized protein n=1 Tax=Ricinus communis TaxID=3988 RepID=B9RA44_RICCO|nr:uncharacterized protein LOC8275470 [Ricinus communis]EEF51671.1 conserved hypothetical protein [Ricinus communis]|eukprot:XP_002511069.1 uncharacterized protein LOC8275470 [Ricinus communis]